MPESKEKRREIIPLLSPTCVSESVSPGDVQVKYRHRGREVSYHRRYAGRKNGPREIPRVPIVLTVDGSPWVEASLYLLDRAKGKPLTTGSLAPIAADLATYRAWLDEYGFEWDDFDSHDKYATPTYQYRAFLGDEMDAGRLKRSLARRRISSLQGFYRHMMEHPRYGFEPVHRPWREKKIGLPSTDGKGFERIIEVTTTDLAVAGAETGTAWDLTINDGGQLRPLPMVEQVALFNALKSLGNTEYWLMHLVSVITGARIQTVLTLRLKYFLAPPTAQGKLFKLQCGPGTGIDTKFNKAKVWLSIPRALYEALHTYAKSERALRRQDKSVTGRDGDNYLFLTQHGNPFYEAKDDLLKIGRGKKTQKVAQGVWDFINKQVIPEVRKTLPDFSYRFHDMRATFGLNWCDAIERIEGGKHSYQWALNQLKQRMWHNDSKTTEHYLKYRQNHELLEKAEEAYGLWLSGLIEST
ncbi:integrase [Herbaspirillum sp. LeCh32-8]|uniref:integrase n=1 Tax=Herbaspirillum sp. LeCh32-8 TaxID=2821356 RepID=UPI001AEB15CD|nr:integrase [Herbaspirillum sp. LeCh32-8]MBP0596883.1 integrase [Herbaspirillum sp. LeCh32-8]